jgi:4-carboxymuconolactone decarboxylase
MTKLPAQFDAGLKVRTEVLGAAHVQRSLVPEGDFNEPLQTFVTEIGWGYVWDRPGLDRRSRSLITVAMLIALSSEHELKVHLRGAINNGVTEAELQEVLLQSAIYAGAPAALAASRTAKQVLQDIRAEAAGGKAG